MQYEATTEAALVIRRGPRILVRQCGATERWAGLWDFPRFTIESEEASALGDELRTKALALTGLAIGALAPLTIIKHGVTRFRITLHCFTADCDSSRKQPRAAAPLKWIEPCELHTLPLSTTGRRIARLLGESL
jgi:A/G-specific adenine glycosylase